MLEQFNPGTTVRVTKAYQRAYPDPLTLSAGEEVTLGRRDDEWVGWVWCTDRAGTSGWAPERWIEQHGDTGQMRRDYTAAELTAEVGEILTVELEESGWLWAVNPQGERGWIPVAHVEEG
jgi:hypothetical protein